MSEMGTLRTTVAIQSLARGETRVIEDALVDTGSEYSWVPREVLESLGIAEMHLSFQLADGRTLQRPLGMAILHVAERLAPDWVVFAEPGDAVLLGAHSLEGRNYRVDPRSKQLVDAGPVIAAVAA